MIVLSDKLSTESFHAFIDEQLNDDQYLQVEEQLDEIPEKVEEIQQCQMVNERLREVFDPIVEEDIPQDLFELALYGVISEREEDTQDFQQYGYEFDEGLNAITGYEDDITSPMDSMGSALELQDEEFIDDNEFADLEALSGQEGMADFDIDAIRNDNNNIIPDIFDNDGEQPQQSPAPLQSQAASSLDDEAMLDSIESLSLEPLDATDNTATSGSTGSVSSEPVTEYVESANLNDTDVGIDVSELELESLTQTEEAATLSEFAAPTENFEIEEQETEQLTEQQIAKERVLETLEASEDLSLEPLQTEQDAEAINLSADMGQTEVPETIALPAEDEKLEETVAEHEAGQEAHTRHVLGGADLGELSSSDNAVLESVTSETQSEFSAELAKSVDSESGHDPAQPQDNEPEESQTKSAENAVEPASDTPETINDQIDAIINRLDEIPGGENGAPPDVVAEFFAENKAEPDFEVSEVVKQFEEVSDEFNQQHHQDPFDSPVTQIKQKADDVLNVINNKIFALKKSILKKEDDSFPDFNQAPTFRTPASPKVNPTEFAGHQGAVDARQANEPQTPFDFDIGIEGDEPKSEQAPRKIGDTLKSYTQKMSQQKAADSGEAAFNVGKDVVLHEEAATGFNKYKQIAVDAVEQVSPENRMTIGGVILLVIGLVIGGSTVSLFGASAGVISGDKVEQLAIDAHILYTQQDQNFAGNPSTSITESMQWLSARIGRHIRLADVKLEGFKHQRAIVMPTMVSYATANIFENTGKEKITLFISGNIDSVPNSLLICRVPTGVDGLCSWVKDSVRYVAVANLSLSRVRAFSQTIADKL